MRKYSENTPKTVEAIRQRFAGKGEDAQPLIQGDRHKAVEAEGSLRNPEALQNMALIFKRYFEKHGELVKVEVNDEGLDIFISAPAVIKFIAQGSRVLPTQIKYTKLNIIKCFNLADMFGIEIPRDLEKVKKWIQEPGLDEALKRANAKVSDAEELMNQAEEKSSLAEEMMYRAKTKATEAEEKLGQAEAKASEVEERQRRAEARISEAEMKTFYAEAKASEAEEKLRQAEAKGSEAEEKLRQAEAKASEAEEKLRQAEAKGSEAEEKFRQAEAKASEAEEMINRASAKDQLAAETLRRAEEIQEHVNARALETEQRLSVALTEAEQAEKKLNEAETRALRAEELLSELKEIASKQAEENKKSAKSKVDMKKVGESAAVLLQSFATFSEAIQTIEADNTLKAIKATVDGNPAMYGDLTPEFFCEVFIFAYQREYNACTYESRLDGFNASTIRYNAQSFFFAAFSYCQQNGNIKLQEKLLNAVLQSKKLFPLVFHSFYEVERFILKFPNLDPMLIFKAVTVDVKTFKQLLFSVNGPSNCSDVQDCFFRIVQMKKPSNQILFNFIMDHNEIFDLLVNYPKALQELYQAFGTSSRAKISDRFLNAIKDEAKFKCKITGYHYLRWYFTVLNLVDERRALLSFLTNNPIAFDERGVFWSAQEKNQFTQGLYKINDNNGAVEFIQNEGEQDDYTQDLSKLFDKALETNQTAYEKAYPKPGNKFGP